MRKMAAAATTTEAAPAAVPDGPIVLYDGACGLCARSVRWVLRHERDTAIRFAPLQGPTAAALRARHPQIADNLDTIVYVEVGRAHLRSKAFLHLAAHLRRPWSWAHAMRWLPGFVLDLGYRLVARLRYRIWGTVDACEIPAPAHRGRFLP
ncbi:MAG: putative thiol-disulfide oxidoreductase [Deltaproteobacteria bacterium]|nr:putative thiol-disulfide oxidoreductase [Deltaproteobacteria bacterium]